MGSETKAKPLVIYHANCTDGFTAAWVTSRALGDVELLAGFYGTEPPDVKGRTVYVVDFSYKRPAMERLAADADYLIVLDHHKTAQADLDGLVTNPAQALVTFDMNRSGARLAWDHFVDGSGQHLNRRHEIAAGANAEWLIDYVQDRDLWRWALPNSRNVSAGIEAYARTLDQWDQLASRNAEQLAFEGSVIENYRRRCIEAACELARFFTFKPNYRVPTANSSEMRFASDTAHELAKGYPFAATYWVRADGMVQFSLRSHEDGVDVSEIAKSYGGGGHRHAAGFQLGSAEFTIMLMASGPLRGL